MSRVNMIRPGKACQMCGMYTSDRKVEWIPSILKESLEDIRLAVMTLRDGPGLSSAQHHALWLLNRETFIIENLELTEEQTEQYLALQRTIPKRKRSRRPKVCRLRTHELLIKQF